MSLLSPFLVVASLVGRRIGRRQANRASALVFIVVLVAGWFATAANMVVSWRDFPSGGKLLSRFEAFFHDHLAGRNVLLSANACLKVDVLGASPTPRVWLGNQGWLFYNAEAESTYLQPGDPALKRRLDGWVRVIPAWRAWLAECGIHLLVVVAPDKQSVYPEHLPHVRRPNPATRPLDRVLTGWRADSGLTVLDLRGPLASAKKCDQVYFRTDTHWTPAGCFTAYSHTVTAMTRWHPGLAPRKATAFDWPFYHLHTADLMRLLALPRDAGETYTMPQPLVGQNWDPSGPCVMLFHDSFADELFVSLLGQHCARLTAVASRQLDAGMIERDCPDVVILEFAERYLQAETPLSPTSPPSSRRGKVRPLR